LRRTTLVSLAVAALAAGVPQAAAAAPPKSQAASAAEGNVAARIARGDRQLAKRGARPPMRRRAVGRTSAFADAWFGSGAECVGQFTTLSLGRQFGLPAGTYFSWRSRLWMYNPSSGVRGWSNWSYTVSDRVTTGSGLYGTSTAVFSNASGGINPSTSPHITWTIPRGWWVMPYVQVLGYGERPVNYHTVYAPNDFSQPNWCFIA
jgi:hypothetical protein